jgi:hypothetical protein
VHEDAVLAHAGQAPREHCGAPWSDAQTATMLAWWEEHGRPDAVAHCASHTAKAASASLAPDRSGSGASHGSFAAPGSLGGAAALQYVTLPSTQSCAPSGQTTA